MRRNYFVITHVVTPGQEVEELMCDLMQKNTNARQWVELCCRKIMSMSAKEFMYIE